MWQEFLPINLNEMCQNLAGARLSKGSATYPNIYIFQLSIWAPHFFKTSNASLDQELRDPQSNCAIRWIVYYHKNHSPSLHVSLPVLFVFGVIKFECTNSHACHEQERDILNLFYFLLIGILSKTVNLVHKPRIFDHYTRWRSWEYQGC